MLDKYCFFSGTYVLNDRVFIKVFQITDFFLYREC